MRGVYHSTITLIFGFTIFFPLSSIMDMANLLPNTMFIWALLMVLIGSMIPDVDAPDSIFFREYPNVSRFFKYFIYYPIAHIYSDRKHRGIMHTLPGIIITTALFFGYMIGFSLLIGILLLLFIPNILETIINTIEGMENVPIDLLYIAMFFLVTATAFIFGMFAHLWEDSTTVSGIRWFPNKDYISKGNLKVGGNNEHLAFGVYSGFGVIIAFFEFGNADENLFLQIFLPIASFLVFLGLGVLFRHPIFRKLLGEDYLLKDIKIREKARDNRVEITIRGFSYHMERDRIKRGLILGKEFKNLGRFNKRVNQTIIDQGGRSLACSCKDFKNVQDLTLCKHLIGYLYLKYPEDQTNMEEQS